MKYGYELANCANYELLKQFAKENRANPTEAESVMWDLLRRNSLGVKFRRQYVISDFIADFICLQYRLIIEIDGKYHTLPDQVISDNERSDRLNALGFYVIRFTNEQILFDTDYVKERIEYHIKTSVCHKNKTL